MWLGLAFSMTSRNNLLCK